MVRLRIIEVSVEKVHYFAGLVEGDGGIAVGVQDCGALVTADGLALAPD